MVAAFPMNARAAAHLLLAQAGWLAGAVRAGEKHAWRRLPLVRLAAARHDTAWPWRVRPWLARGDVLDVGCGRNLQGIGFLAAGARTYTGLDPTLDLHSTKLKDSRTRWSRRVEGEFTLAQLMAENPRLRYARQTLAEFADAQPGSFDVLVMHNVTEHLLDLPAEFARFARHLRPGGRIVFRHPNFYCWHGHHMRPRTVAEIDGSAEQTPVVDWAHVRFDPVAHAWIAQTQNRIRLDELRALVERHFALEQWEETDSPREQGLERLTPEILARHPGFTRRELAVKCAFVVARKAE